MRVKGFISTVLLIAFYASIILLPASASANNFNPSVIISQIKVTTSGQFVTLYNNTALPIDMSGVKLEYLNHYSPSQATSGKVIALSGVLPANSYFMASDDSQPICYKMQVQAATLGFSTSSGSLRIINFNASPIGLVEDSIGWVNKTPPSGVQLMPATPAFLQRQQENSAPKPSGSWQTVQPDETDPCKLITFATPKTPVSNTLGLILASTQPPATIVSIMSLSTGGGSAASNIGLKAPIITELLPNPASPQTDSENEFIEIYNPNNTTFDLSGFKLQTKSTSSATKRTYTFPSGTKIPAESWAAYPSENISISLNNSGAQVWLLDPNENLVSQADAYGKAEDGFAWALAEGKWYWTAAPTPSVANVIRAGGSGQSSSGSNGVGTVSGASTTGVASAANSNLDAGEKVSSLHPGVLVGVGILALLYGIYEYRQDIANFIQRAKRNRTAGRKSG